MAQTNLPEKQRQTHRHREQTCGCQGGGRREWDRLGVWGDQMQTITFSIMNNKVLLYSTGKYTQHLVINHNGKEYKNEYICTYVQLNYFAIQQKLTQHCKPTIRQYNFFKRCCENLSHRQWYCHMIIFVQLWRLTEVESSDGIKNTNQASSHNQYSGSKCPNGKETKEL